MPLRDENRRPLWKVTESRRKAPAHSRIAVCAYTSWWQLATYNHHTNANHIFPNQSLCIPQGTPPLGGSDPAHRTYVTLASQNAVAAGISPEIYPHHLNQESGFDPASVSPERPLGLRSFCRERQKYLA